MFCPPLLHILDVLPFLPCRVCSTWIIYVYTLRGFNELTQAWPIISVSVPNKKRAAKPTPLSSSAQARCTRGRNMSIAEPADKMPSAPNPQPPASDACARLWSRSCSSLSRHASNTSRPPRRTASSPHRSLDVVATAPILVSGCISFRGCLSCPWPM